MATWFIAPPAGVGAGACRVSKSGDAWKVEPAYRFEGNNPLANHWSTPVLQDGHLYGMFQFKEYGSGPVKCVDIRTGGALGAGWLWTGPGGPG